MEKSRLGHDRLELENVFEFGRLGNSSFDVMQASLNGGWHEGAQPVLRSDLAVGLRGHGDDDPEGGKEMNFFDVSLFDSLFLFNWMIAYVLSTPSEGSHYLVGLAQTKDRVSLAGILVFPSR